MSKKETTKDFTVNKKEFFVVRPNSEVSESSDAIYAKSIRKAVIEGYLTEHEIETALKNRGYTEEFFDNERKRISKEIKDLELRLSKKTYSSKEEGQNIAKQLIKLRDDLLNIEAPKNELTKHSAERYAEDQRIQFLTFSCTFDKSTNSKVWQSLDEFRKDFRSLDSSNERTKIAASAGLAFMQLMYQEITEFLDEEEKSRPEYKWMQSEGLMDEKMNFLDDKGRRIDSEGKLIDGLGRYIDENGNKVDYFGNPIDVPINKEELPENEEEKTTQKVRKKVNRKSERSVEPSTTGP